MGNVNVGGYHSRSQMRWEFVKTVMLKDVRHVRFGGATHATDVLMIRQLFQAEIVSVQMV